MTHLHLIGLKAGLEQRPGPEGFYSSGTIDIYVQGGDADLKHYAGMEPWQAGRELKRLWDEHNNDDNNYKPVAPSIWNAESYAAAALEFYFLHFCEWDVILPK